MWTFNTAAQAKINEAKDKLSTATTATLAFVPVPTIFMGVLDGNGIQARSAIAFTPGLANLQPVNNIVYSPKQYGPKNAAGNDVFETETQSVIPSINFVPDWNDYHRKKGEVHCGTNVTRKFYDFKWWEKQP